MINLKIELDFHNLLLPHLLLMKKKRNFFQNKTENKNKKYKYRLKLKIKK